MIIAITGFCYFVFLKIFTAIFFKVGLSLIGALVSAVLILGLELAMGFHFYQKLAFARFQSSIGMPHEFSINKVWIAWLASLPLMTGIVILVSVGFSHKFYDKVLEGSYRKFLDWDHILVLLVGVGIMTLPRITLFTKVVKIALASNVGEEDQY